MNINQIHFEQVKLFNSNISKNVEFRIEQLKKLRTALKENETLLFNAIDEDFGKSKFETYVAELSFVYNEIELFIKNLAKWSKRKRVRTGLANFPAKSYIIPEPLGTTLIIGAWNYPYQLSLVPALTSLAAGNTVILKPSEIASKTSAAMATIINKTFNENYFHVIEGGQEITSELLKLQFDKIFFTGSTKVGRIIYEAAAKNLIPVTLELGGKSPTFVFNDVDINVTAKRIVWAKFLNAGQTCVAPDYILVEQSIEEKFLSALKIEIEKQFSDVDVSSDHYLKIINDRNWERLNSLIDVEKIYTGGVSNKEKRFISPTILKNVSFEDEIMKDEIFGPILPIISFSDLDAVIKKVKLMPKPLSLYVYSKSRSIITKILSELSFGGGAVNDSMMHLSNSNLPFGGVGFSGMGSYHGKAGFDTFTHYKSILDKPFWLETNLKYPPYSDMKLKIIKMFLK